MMLNQSIIFILNQNVDLGRLVDILAPIEEINATFIQIF